MKIEMGKVRRRAGDAHVAQTAFKSTMLSHMCAYAAGYPLLAFTTELTLQSLYESDVTSYFAHPMIYITRKAAYGLFSLHMTYMYFGSHSVVFIQARIASHILPKSQNSSSRHSYRWNRLRASPVDSLQLDPNIPSRMLYNYVEVLGGLHDGVA